MVLNEELPMKVTLKPPPPYVERLRPLSYCNNKLEYHCTDLVYMLKHLALDEAILAVFVLTFSLFITFYRCWSAVWFVNSFCMYEYDGYVVLFAGVFNIAFTSVFGLVTVGFPCNRTVPKFLTGQTSTDKRIRYVYLLLLVLSVVWSIIFLPLSTSYFRIESIFVVIIAVIAVINSKLKRLTIVRFLSSCSH